VKMSLGRLLAAGRSLVGAHNGESRYRINKRVALPKFISPRNPFAKASKAESPAEIRGGGATGATARADTNTAGKEDSRTGMRARAVRWIGEWSRKVNPLARAQKQPGPARSAVPVSEGRMQPELSLDNVRVVRNDLSDADFEVVAKKSPVAGRFPSPGVPVQARWESAGSAWDRMTARFFGARST